MLPITIPYLGEEEAAAAAEVIHSGWVTQGPKVAEFERVVAEYCGTVHAVPVSSGERWEESNPHLESRLRASEFASANSLLLPLFPQMTDEQQDKVLTGLCCKTTAATAWNRDRCF